MRLNLTKANLSCFCEMQSVTISSARWIPRSSKLIESDTKQFNLNVETWELRSCGYPSSSSGWSSPLSNSEASLSNCSTVNVSTSLEDKNASNYCTKTL